MFVFLLLPLKCQSSHHSISTEVSSKSVTLKLLSCTSSQPRNKDCALCLTDKSPGSKQDINWTWHVTTPTREKQIAGGSLESGYPKYDQPTGHVNIRAVEDYWTRITSLCTTVKHPHPTMEVILLVFLVLHTKQTSRSSHILYMEAYLHTVQDSKVVLLHQPMEPNTTLCLARSLWHHYWPDFDCSI